MRVWILAAAGALLLGLVVAGEAQAACNCEIPSQYQVVNHRARHAPVVRTQIVYGDRRASDRTRNVEPYAPAYAPEPIYDAPAAYYDHGYDYAAPVGYWGGYLPYGDRGYGYRSYGYRPYGYRPDGYGWRSGYPGGAHYRGSVYRGGGYRGGGAVYVGGAGWRR